ncbi:MAG TPA: HU family DNA-binding protein [Candidatus Paceibacterota bacterium]
MKKEDIIVAVLKAANLATKKQAQESVEAVFEGITKALTRGEEVAVAGFGVFRVMKSAARAGVNPKTGEKIQIKASKKPKFRAAKALKEAVK